MNPGLSPTEAILRAGLVEVRSRLRMSDPLECELIVAVAAILAAADAAPPVKSPTPKDPK